jgi:hypothetical protein
VKEKSMESVLTPPQEKSHHHSPFNAMGILSSPCLTQPPSSFHPTAFVASRLWNIYKDTVDVCTSAQLLHVPTDELKLYSVIHDPANASYENLAFCYAIYYSSTVTLDEEEARAMMGQDRTTCLHTFKLGLEQSLAYGDFLDSPTVTMLAALSMYLGALRVQNQGKGVWTLNGLAIRMAQSIGLHRDGERLGLSPFQSEINRRLWWQLMCREGRAGEDYGLRHTKGLNFPSFDVRQPHNIDDVDLCPDSKEMPPERRSWTRTTFVLIKICIHEAQKKLASIAAAATATVFPSEAVRAQVVKESKARIEELLQYCNPVIPQQRLAMICARQIIQKLDFLTRHEWHLLDPGSRREDFATDENLKEAIGIVSVRDLTKDPLMDQFAMSNRAYPQYHVAMYVLWHLCVRPEGPYVASAWDAVDSMLELDQKKGCADQRYGYKSAVLRALKAKAMAIRDGTRRESDGSGIGDGQQQEPQQGTDVQIAADTAASYGDVYHMSAQLLQNGGMFGTAGMTAAGDPRNEDWQDWTMAAHSFHFDDEAMCNVFW